jgi:hypothetical protein
MKPFRADLEAVGYFEKIKLAHEFSRSEDFIDYLLFQFENMPFYQRFGMREDVCSLSDFQNMDNMAGNSNEELDRLEKEGVGYFGDVKVTDLDSPVDQSIVNSTAHWESGDGAYLLTRLHHVPIDFFRGRAKFIWPKMYSLKHADIRPDGTYETITRYLGNDGTNWRSIGATNDILGVPFNTGDDEEKNLIEQLNMLVSIQFTNRYYWQVSFGFGGPSIAFKSDPSGLKEMFKLREIPPGKKRRSAIRNWISAHNRKASGTSDEWIKVRKHLRGQTDFVWNGMKVQVRPAAYDLDLNKSGRLK